MTKNWNEYFPPKYERATDWNAPRQLTFTRIVTEKMRDGSQKPVAYFKETSKGFVLNKTNVEFLKTLSRSDNPDDCCGLVVILAPVEIEFNGEPTKALRFRKVPPGQGAHRPGPGTADPDDDIPPF